MRIKRFVAAVLIAAVIFMLACTCVSASDNCHADWNDDVDYFELMKSVLTECGDDGLEVAKILEQKRNQKIVDTHANVDTTHWYNSSENAEQFLKKMNGYQLLHCKNYTADDVDLLAHLLYMECGSYWLPDDWLYKVGQVALNRVWSIHYPNTLYDVVYQPGQYDRNWLYATQQPTERCYRIARDLLEGERVIDLDVVFQAGGPQGSEIYMKLYDSIYGYTYLCKW